MVGGGFGRGVGSPGCRAVGIGLWGILVDVHLVGVYNSLVFFNGGAARRAGGGGRSGQSRLLAECASPQLKHLAGEARQHPRMALRFPPLGHDRLGQRCSALVCWREHSGHV